MKAMGGGGGSFSRSSQKAEVKAPTKVKHAPKKLSHADLLNKWAAQGGKFAVSEKKRVWTKADIEHAKAQKDAAARGEVLPPRAPRKPRVRRPEGTEGPDDDGVIEEESEDEEPYVPRLLAPPELARARMAGMAQELLACEAPEDALAEEPAKYAEASLEELQGVAECRRQQFTELDLLEAMFVDEYLLFSDADETEALKAALEALPDPPTGADAEALRSVAEQPPLDFALQMTVQDQRPPEQTDGRQLVASILLRVRFPFMYPTPGVPPTVHVVGYMVADSLGEPQEEDSSPSTLAEFDAEEMTKAMLAQVTELQPDPIVYEMATWMSDNAFAFVRPVAE